MSPLERRSRFLALWSGAGVEVVRLVRRVTEAGENQRGGFRVTAVKRRASGARQNERKP